MREADNTIKFTFDSPQHSVDINAIQAALEAEGAIPQEAAQEAKPNAEEVPVAGNTPADAESQQAAAPSPTAKPEGEPQKDELRTYKITVDGQELEVTEADLKSGHMRHRDYTQKAQKLAEDRKAIEAERKAWEQERTAIAQELMGIDQFLRDQAAMDAYYAKAFGVRRGEQIQLPQVSPDQPLTAQQVADIARYNAEQVRIHTDRQIAEARAEALKAQQLVLQRENAAREQAAAGEIQKHVKGILDKYPVLKKFEDIEDELMGEAAKHMPTDRKGTVQDALQRLSEAADRRVATIRAIAEDEKKAAAVAAANLKKTGTQEPGGAAPKPAPGRKLSLNAKDRKDFLAAAEADLRAMLGKD